MKLSEIKGLPIPKKEICNCSQCIKFNKDVDSLAEVEIELEIEEIIQVFRNLGTHILHYHDKENRTTNEQVIHEARWREIAQALNQNLGKILRRK